MAGVVRQYQQIARYQKIVSTKTISSDGGVNPVDSGPVDLPNIRGKIVIRIMASDNVTLGDEVAFSQGEFFGGFGEFTNDPTFFFANVFEGTRFCTIENPDRNIFVFDTEPNILPSLPPGSPQREYTLTFSRLLSRGPTIEKTGGPDLGAADLTVEIRKEILV